MVLELSQHCCGSVTVTAFVKVYYEQHVRKADLNVVCPSIDCGQSLKILAAL